MSGSYRGIFLALVGWLILAATAPNNGIFPKQTAQPQQTQPDTEIAHAANTVAAAINNTVGSPDHDRRCDQDQDNRNSDLCAQWKAADSAEETADWAARGFFASLLGIGLLLVTLRYTVKGTQAAVDAVEAQIETERPLMLISKAKIAKGDEPEDEPDAVAIKLSWSLINQGKTGCWLEKWCVYPAGIPNDENLPLICGTEFEENRFVHCAPNTGVSIAEDKSSKWTFRRGAAEAIRNTKSVYLLGYSVYRDTGYRRWRTSFAYQIELDDNFSGEGLGPVPSENLWEDLRLPGSQKEAWYVRWPVAFLRAFDDIKAGRRKGR